MEIYLDNSATTRPSKGVIAAMVAAMEIFYGNPSSLHRKGFEAEKIINQARRAVADVLNADPSEIYFTSGGTESNNLGIRGYLERNPHAGKRIVTSNIEHPSILNLYKFLEKRHEAVYLPVDERGRITLADLENAVNGDTAVVSIMAVNNEIGSIQPLEAIGKTIKKINPKTVFHVDAVQALGKIPVDVEKMKIDLLSASGHKFHGPKGIGILYARRGLKLNPLFYGGNQEGGMRSGTENVPAISGIGMAAQEMLEAQMQRSAHMARYKELLTEALKREFTELSILSEGVHYAPNIVNVCFKDVKAEVLLHSLEQDGIFVSSGSACSSKKKGNSHVLEAIRVPGDYIGGAIRISFTWENDLSEIDVLVESLKRHVGEIRSIMRR